MAHEFKLTTIADKNLILFNFAVHIIVSTLWFFSLGRFLSRRLKHHRWDFKRWWLLSFCFANFWLASVFFIFVIAWFELIHLRKPYFKVRKLVTKARSMQELCRHVGVPVNLAIFPRCCLQRPLLPKIMQSMVRSSVWNTVDFSNLALSLWHLGHSINRQLFLQT